MINLMRSLLISSTEAAEADVELHIIEALEMIGKAVETLWKRCGSVVETAVRKMCWKVAENMIEACCKMWVEKVVEGQRERGTTIDTER